MAFRALGSTLFHVPRFAASWDIASAFGFYWHPQGYLLSVGGGWQQFKKLLLLLLDSLNSGSNKNLADLDDDEKWLARTYFPMLIAESESSPEDALEHVPEVATIFTNTALRRVFNFCTPIVLADLLMIILRCLPTEVYSDQSIQACVAQVQTTCNSTVTL